MTVNYFLILDYLLVPFSTAQEDGFLVSHTKFVDMSSFDDRKKKHD